MKKVGRFDLIDRLLPKADEEKKDSFKKGNSNSKSGIKKKGFVSVMPKEDEKKGASRGKQKDKNKYKKKRRR